MQNIEDMSSNPERHPTFWFHDGSLVLQIDAVAFQVHRTVLTRHSPFLLSLEGNKHRNGFSGATTFSDSDHIGYIRIDPSRKVSARDFEVLLEHLYHDVPLSPDAPFPRIASVLRVSSPNQLHFPRIHDVALRYFADLFPSGPAPFVHPPFLEEALALAVAFNVPSIQKGLYYSLVTCTNFDTDNAAANETGDKGSQLPSDRPTSHSLEKPDERGNADPQPAGNSPGSGQATSGAHTEAHVLSVRDAQRCTRLMTHFIDYFTPILFTAPATPHMACTDVFAETWMRLVVQPAIEDQGVYKPLETLENFKRVDWAEVGLCPACVIQKREEWTAEQESVWDSMDRWLES